MMQAAQLGLISIHAPHARSDLMDSSFVSIPAAFQSTLLMRGATAMRCMMAYATEFQSTLLMRGATRSDRYR